MQPPSSLPANTSGSGAYHYDWERGGIVHIDGRRWRGTPRQEQVYAALDACRGSAFSAERLALALYGDDDNRYADNIRLYVFGLRKLCGPDVVETTLKATLGKKKIARGGYFVRECLPDVKVSAREIAFDRWRESGAFSENAIDAFMAGWEFAKNDR
jgi:hypothetical protein